jgi:PhzF family phenazine biosynthesis protein
MDTVRTRLVDAFTGRPLAGNAAGVVPDADGLTEDQMQAIARELSVSETAFLLSSDDADRAVRYFTPTQEVDLCGHATVGAHYGLFADDAIGAGTHSLETGVGVLDVEVTEEGFVWMTQDAPTVRTVDVDYDRVAAALGVEPTGLTGLADDLPLAVASTGLPFLTIPAEYLSDLSDATPDMGAIEELTAAVDATGVYLFTFDALLRESTLHGRMFAPGAGVPEDPVTGTASGAVGAYLRHFGAFEPGQDPEGAAADGTAKGFPDELVLEQGHFVDRPGEVRVRVGEAVRVGGRGVLTLDGELAVPPAEEDEILEA